MTGVLWDLRGRKNLPSGDARREAELAETVERLTTVCLAMWTLIQEKTDLTEDDLFDRVRELDVSDGVEDDKLTRFPRPCPACKRLMSAEHKRCMYCGLTPEHETAFDAV